MSKKPTPEVGQVWRDTNGDSRKTGWRNKRTIRLTASFPNGFHADVLSDVDGEPPAQPRTTTLMTRTLLAGYVLVEPAPVMEG